VSRTTKLPRIPGCLGIRRGHGPYKGRIGLDDRDVIISVPEGMSCIFCDLDRSILAETKLSFAVLDSFPVSDGHTLVIPKRHVASIWEMTTEEYTDTFKLVGKVKDILQQHFGPQGFNVGVNCGKAAGQTVFHAHIHLIPRYTGDVPNPRGGVRNIIPSIGDY
jgi:diadenosine tetraphosphate (Ap4A) HIT family hydrolase